MTTMRDGICPICGSSEVYDDRANNMRGYRNLLPVWAFGQARLVNYVCTTCGYTECYVRDQKSKDLIQKHWLPTDGRKKKNS